MDRAWGFGAPPSRHRCVLEDGSHSNAMPNESASNVGVVARCGTSSAGMEEREPARSPRTVATPSGPPRRPRPPDNRRTHMNADQLRRALDLQ